MEYFLEVCKYESILKASTNLHITQQALSKSMKKIENLLETNLFIRGTNSIKLTENGKFLYEKVKLQLENHNKFLNELDEKFKEKNKVLKLGLVPGSLRSLGADILMNFIEANKGIKLEIIEAYDHICEEMIRNNTLDIAISTKPVNNKELKYMPIKKEKLFVIFHKNLLSTNKKTLSPLDLENIPMVLCDENLNLHINVKDEFQKYGIIPNIILKANEIEIMVDLVSKAKAINICAEHVTHDLEKKNIISLELETPNTSWEIGILTQKNMDNDKDLLSFLEILNSNFKDVTPSL